MASPSSQLLSTLTAEMRGPSLQHRRIRVAEILGVVGPLDLKRPGEAKNWTSDDWAAWAKEHGFTSSPSKNNDATSYIDPDTGLGFVVARHWDDPRSGLAVAKEVRDKLTGSLDVLAEAVATYISETAPQLVLTPTEQIVPAVAAGVKQAMKNQAFLARVNKNRVARVTQATVTPEDEATTAELRRLLKKLEEATGSSQRALLRSAMSTSRPDDVTDDAEWDRHVEGRYHLLKNGTTLPAVITDSITENLKDLLEAHEQMEKEAAEAKRAAREKPEAAVQPPPPPPPPPSPLELFQTLLESETGALVKLSKQLADLVEVKGRALMRSAAALTTTEYPAEEIESYKLAIADLRQQLNAASAATTAAQKECDALFEACSAKETELVKLRNDHAAAEELVDSAASSSDWKEAMALLITRVREKLEVQGYAAVAAGAVQARSILDSARNTLQAGKIPTFER